MTNEDLSTAGGAAVPLKLLERGMSVLALLHILLLLNMSLLQTQPLLCSAFYLASGAFTLHYLARMRSTPYRPLPTADELAARRARWAEELRAMGGSVRWIWQRKRHPTDPSGEENLDPGQSWLGLGLQSIWLFAGLASLAVGVLEMYTALQ